MKIEKIDTFEEGKIIVTVSGYPHAQPVFDADITPEDLQVALKAWKVNQDAVDLINSQPKQAKPVVEVDSKLTALINKEIK